MLRHFQVTLKLDIWHEGRRKISKPYYGLFRYQDSVRGVKARRAAGESGPWWTLVWVVKPPVTKPTARIPAVP